MSIVAPALKLIPESNLMGGSKDMTKAELADTERALYNSHGVPPRSFIETVKAPPVGLANTTCWTQVVAVVMSAADPGPTAL